MVRTMKAWHPMRISRIYAPALVAALAALFAVGTASAGERAVVRVVPESNTVASDAREIPVHVDVSAVRNLAGFQFLLVFDGDILEFERIERGPFVASSGREVSCNEPQHDIGTVRYECVTLGPAGQSAGVSGDGRLATVYLRVKGGGDTQLSLSRVQLAAAIPDLGIAADIENATISVSNQSSTDWLLWGGAVGGGVALAVAGGAMGLWMVRSRRAPMAVAQDGVSNSSTSPG
jgi:hypothetical protein